MSSLTPAGRRSRPTAAVTGARLRHAPPPALLAAVALGGALGALLRHAVDVVADVGALQFPWPTLLINASGSAALAALGVLATLRRRPLVQTFVGPGLLGGWTTLSAYAEQGRRLLGGGRPGLAAAYLVGTLAACLLGVVAGATLGRRLHRTSATGGPERGAASGREPA